MDRRQAAKLTLGLILVASSIAVFLLYLAGGYGPLYLVPLGVLPFSAGFYLCMQQLKFLQPFKRVIPVFAVALLLIGLVPPAAWQNSVFGSVYGSFLTLLTRKLGVLMLNAEGIGAVEGAGSTIVLPSASKVAAVTIEQACGGVEEVLVFCVAFALMLVDVGKNAPKKAMILLPVGFLGVYMISVVRLDAVVVAGYLYGFGVMETVHMYAGVLLYLVFISAFWYLSLKWIGPRRRAESAAHGGAHGGLPAGGGMEFCGIRYALRAGDHETRVSDGWSRLHRESPRRKHMTTCHLRPLALSFGPSSFLPPTAFSSTDLSGTYSMNSKGTYFESYRRSLLAF